MEDALGDGAATSSSSGEAAAGRSSTGEQTHHPSVAAPASPSRYEAQKRRDWNTFGQYLRNRLPPLPLDCCTGAHVLDFLRYLDQFGKTKVHAVACGFYGLAHPPAPCGCPLRQAWGSLDSLVGRLRAAFEEHGGAPERNPFAARAVGLHLREVREVQAMARGIAYEKRKRKRAPAATVGQVPASAAAPAPAPAPAAAATASNRIHCRQY